MFRITRDPSSGNSIHCLAKITVITITVILAKHCTNLPDDGSLVIRNMLEQFKIFLNIL